MAALRAAHNTSASPVESAAFKKWNVAVKLAMADKQMQDYIESLLAEMSGDATLEDLIRKIGEMQRKKILEAARVEAERLQTLVDERVKERRRELAESEPLEIVEEAAVA